MECFWQWWRVCRKRRYQTGFKPVVDQHFTPYTSNSLVSRVGEGWDIKLSELSRLPPYHSHDPLTLHWTASRSSPVSSALLLQGKIWAQLITLEQSGCIQEVLNQCWIVSSFCICFNKIPQIRWHREVYFVQILVAGESDIFAQLCSFILTL